MEKKKSNIEGKKSSFKNKLLSVVLWDAHSGETLVLPVTVVRQVEFISAIFSACFRTLLAISRESCQMCNMGMLRDLKNANLMALKWKIPAKGWRQTSVKEGLVLSIQGN